MRSRSHRATGYVPTLPPLPSVIASLGGRTSKKEGILRNDPQQAAATTGLVFIFLSAQFKIRTEVNIWGQVYFGQTNSSLLSKIRESVGCMRLGAPCRRSLSGRTLFSSLLLLPWKKTCNLTSPRVCPRVQTPDWWWDGSN